LWRLHHQPATAGPARRPGLDRLRVRQRGARSRARRARPAPGAAPVPVEIGQVGNGHRPADRGQARILGDPRLPQLRRPMAGAAVLGRLTWQAGTVTSVRDETATARTIALSIPGWPGYRAGQHVDVRLTAADGYSAQRSYSIASAPEDGHVVLTVERLDDGEVSPYLVDELRPGDAVELRGPIGGYFVWEASLGRPLL